MKKSETTSAKKTLVLLTGFSCNNNCAICSVRERQNVYSDRSKEELISDLKKGRQNGFDYVEFTGGEPTIRKDFLELAGEAKKMGYQVIAISTNGRLLSYPEFCLKAVRAGVNKITFSLLGPDGRTHEAITRSPGSFDQIIEGIKNVQKFKNVHVNVNSAVCRLNYRTLKALGETVLSLGIKKWFLLDLIPDGNAKSFYENLLVRRIPLSRQLNSLVGLCDKFDEFGLADFPVCLLAPVLRKKPNLCLFNAKRRENTIQQIGYDSSVDRIKQNESGIYKDIYRVNGKICKQCIFFHECGGLWQEYLNKFGEEEIKILAKKNQCLK